MNLELTFNLLVVVAVLAVQLYLFWESRRYSGADHSMELDQLKDRFTTDIEQRAQRGLPPDWLRYQADIDRIFEPYYERLRTRASAALAVGLGGTILALILNLIIAQASPLDFEPIDLVLGMGVALLGSFTGITNNLYIILRLLPQAEDRFSNASSQIQGQLETISDTNLPQELFGQTIRDELASLRKALQSELATAFSTALTGLPGVLERLGEQVGGLTEIVTNQGRSINTAIGELRECALAVAQSSTELQPAAQTLAQSTRSLATMPKDLQGVLEVSRSSWLESLREDQEKNVQQLIDLQRQVEFISQTREDRMLEATRQMQAGVGDVRDAVEMLPAQLAHQVDRISGTLGIEFGREARDHINVLSDKLAAERVELLERIEHHEQEWRNNIGGVITGLIRKVTEQVDEQLVKELRQVSEQMRQSIRLLPEVTRELQVAHQDWSSSQKENLEGWERASTSIGVAAESLVDADGQLKIAVKSLTKSSENLDRIASRTAAFEMAVRTALQEVTSKHLDELKPIQRDMLKMLKELGDARAKLDRAFAEVSYFIRDWLTALPRSRQRATSRTMP